MNKQCKICAQDIPCCYCLAASEGLFIPDHICPNTHWSCKLNEDLNSKPIKCMSCWTHLGFIDLQQEGAIVECKSFCKECSKKQYVVYSPYKPPLIQ